MIPLTLSRFEGTIGATMIGVMSGIAVVVAISCSDSANKTAANVVVRVADEVCKSEGTQPSDPEWVAIACTAEGVVSHVVLPRAAWYAARAAAKDAGPGK